MVAKCLFVLLVFALAGCGGGGSNPAADPSKWTETAPANYKAEFVTSAGRFVIECRREWAPKGADRFYNLVKSGFYNSARFFRVVPGFVVQWGMPADPAVGRAWGENTVIPDDPPAQGNLVGFVSFASRGPNSRTTQVFVNLANNAQLDSMGFQPFGRVTTGLDVIYKIYPGYGETPQQPQIQAEGEAYLARDFPKLDKIERASIIP